MIIIKNHFNKNDTGIYSDIISNGCQTFNINQLDEVCEKFKVPAEIKQEIIKYHQENSNIDDVTLNVLNVLKSEYFTALNRAVAFGTKNFTLRRNAGIFKSRYKRQSNYSTSGRFTRLFD